MTLVYYGHDSKDNDERTMVLGSKLWKTKVQEATIKKHMTRIRDSIRDSSGGFERVLALVR